MKQKINIAFYKSYVVTGMTVYGRRFKKATAIAAHAFGINLWNGSIWGIRKDNGKRELLRRVMNG